MRLRDLVGLQGISSFTADDFKFVTSKISADPGRLILVGGQAIAVWGILFDVPSPLGEHQTLTADADWLGTKLDAKWLCDRLGAPADVDLQFAGDSDSTPSSALAFLRRGKRVLMMDFLRAIVGPDTKEIQKLAVEVQLHEASFLVMHPLLCLESRFANLKEIPAKRGGNGPLQATWMINITRAFLLAQVRDGMDREQVAKAIRRVAELAQYKLGKYCLLHFHLNALEAIPDEAIAYAGDGFKDIEWPYIAARIARKQARWRAHHERVLLRTSARHTA